ncbi:hypothetical protein GJAV_G00068480 [Gymnothorax javanicus]|nr:hypothetical protein GJAV_G00068480 [Gymnothorax javanicus]
MAQCVQSVQEFIQDSFVPTVAVLCSEDADKVTRKNNLNFSELVRPFCRLTSEGHMRDPNNQIHLIKNLKISVSNVVTQPPKPALIRRLLDEVVSVSQPAEGLVANVITAGDYDLNISDRSLKASLPWYGNWKETLAALNSSRFYAATTPWFETYRENFLQYMPASEHEFLSHYLACMLVVSSREASPVDQFLKLSQEQHRIQHSGDYSFPKWFIPNTLKYYVLLHDISEGDEQRADSVYEDMKQRYGTQACYLLKINSRTSGTGPGEQIPDPWSQYLQKSSLHNQDLHEEGPTAMVNNTAVENNTSAGEVDGLDPSSKEGIPNNFDSHPLQLDTPSDPGGPQEPLEALKSLGPGPQGEESQLGTSSSRSSVYGKAFCLTFSEEEHPTAKNDQELVSRKGLSRSLFSATKKWFGGGKVPEKSISELRNTAGLLYPPEAPELQIRKMADLCLLVQHYDLAYSCYHTAKKDFLSDQAMLYAAGALEMAAVAAFLHPNNPRPYPAHYMDTAIQTYRDVCKNMVLAERCALLSSEILKSQAKYSDAATLLIKMTSEDSDLRSALLLEQAAHCFINMRNPMVRKFAFHMILAGHRFSKAGQVERSLRHHTAPRVPLGNGMCRALARTQGLTCCTFSQQGDAGVQREGLVSEDHFRHHPAVHQRQPKQAFRTSSSSQQTAFLREYLYVYKHSVSQSPPEGALPQLPLPCIQSSATRVFFGHDRRLAEGEKQAATHVSLDQEYDRDLSQLWKELEEQVVSIVRRGAPASFQPTQYCLNSQTDNTRFPRAVVEEPVIVEVAFRNPLKISLLLTDLSLLWKFTPKNFSRPSGSEAGETVTNEKEAYTQKAPLKNDFISTEVISEFVMSSEETKMARLKLLPHQTGELHILGVVYNLGTTPSAVEGLPGGDALTVRGRQDLEIQGPRLNATKEEKTSVRHGPDRRLDPIITPPCPCSRCSSLTSPQACCAESQVAPLTPISPSASEHCSAYKTVLSDQATVSLVSPADFGTVRDGRCPGVLLIPLPDSVLQPGASVQLPMWLRGPDREGVHEINFLFYYESTEKSSKLSHRVLRHTAVICASRSLSVRASARRSNTFLEQDGPGGSMLVFVDVENINTNESGVREFHIVQVSSSSQQWRLQKCINPSRDKDSKLTSRQRGKLCFRATKCKTIEATSNAQDKYTFADVNLGNEQIISATTPCADFFFRRCQSAEAKKKAAAGQSGLTHSKGAESGEEDVTGVVQKCSEVDLNIIVLWKAYVVEDNKQLIVEGQLHVALQTIGKEVCSLSQKEEAQEMVLLKFRPELPPPLARPSMEQLSYLIKTNLHYPESYSHPFPEKSLCMVPVTLRLSNCSLAQVDVIIDLRHKATSPETLEVHGSFTWLGQTQYKLRLKAQEIHKLQLTACFIHAGVYNLGTPRVFAKLSDQGSMCETSQQNSMPALIIINNSI